MPADAPIVLLSYARTNRDPLTARLHDALSELIPVQHFSWRRALVGRWDVFNMHWPDHLTKRRGRFSTLARRVLFLALLLRIRFGRKVLVRTLHNIAPHERRRGVEQRLLRLSDRWTDAFITMLPESRAPGAAPATYIPQGHYRDVYDGFERPRPVPGRLLFFGIVRAYKGVPALLDTFRSVGDPALSLRVVGRPFRPEDSAAIEQRTAADSRITADLGWVEHERLAHEIGEAELVVLPYLEMHNSGAMIVALSLDRPVLVPRHGGNAALAVEVGPGWVHLYDPPLAAETLVRTLEHVRAASPRERPDLSARGWNEVAAAYAATFIDTLNRSRSTRTR